MRIGALQRRAISDIADIYFAYCYPGKSILDEIDYEIQRFLKIEYDTIQYDMQYDEYFEKIENIVWGEINQRERLANAKFIL